MEPAQYLAFVGAVCLALVAIGGAWLYIRIKNSNLGRLSRLRENRSPTPQLPPAARNALRALLTEVLIGKPGGRT